MKVMGAFVMLVVLALGVYFFMNGGLAALTPQAPAVQPVVITPEAQPATPTYTVRATWEFREIEDGVSDMMNPQTDAAVLFEVTPNTGVPYTKGPFRLGAFTGSCAEQSQGFAGKEVAGATQYALCWFAGGGTELSVVPQGGQVSLFSRDVSEGSPEVEAIPSEPTTVLTVDLAE